MIILTIINTIAIATFYLLLYITQKQMAKKNKGVQKLCELQKKRK